MKFYGHSREVADRIVEAFRHPEQLPEALAPIFIHGADDVPSSKWSWSNRFILALYGTTDARGIRQWNQIGRRVIPGSKAIHILAPCVKTVTAKDEEDKETEQRFLYGFRSVPVFAVEDTDGEPLPEKDREADTWIASLPLVEVAEAWGIHVGSYAHHGNAPLGYYRPGASGESIMLGVENASTWVHELTHAADHRLGALKEAKWHREIVAELGGAVLLTCIGETHEADLGGAFKYIETYAAEAGMETARACIEVLHRVCDCVDLILKTAQSLETNAVPA
ncbi:MAG: hypothetical protein HUU46_19210 [Candidatus Hydrogenedentes bacterium]|nr:hypothetical protein [Candidatus Hydrogenedentota bacterium]